MIVVKVKVKFRDDKTKEFVCCDNPVVSQGWLVLYPVSGKKSLERLMLPVEGIAEIGYSYANKK